MKIAFSTVLNDSYLVGFLITLNSMIKCSKHFNYDIIVFDWGELSLKSKKTINQLYKNVIYKQVDVDLYKTHQFDDTYRKWTYNCNYRFDVFTLSEYDRVVFFDCDIIFQIDVDELLKYDVDFGACFLEKERVLQTHSEVCFDGGLMTIGKKFLNQNTREMLLEEANKKPPKLKTITADRWLSDEPILNNVFGHVVVFLPQRYNTIVSEIKNDDFVVLNNYQYTGDKKPWNGDVLDEQFSQFTIEKIKKKPAYLCNLIFKKLLFFVKIQIEDLKIKGILVR